MKKINALRATVMATALLSGTSWATDGYFSHGYGIKSKGMGGVSIAMTDTAFAGANNPATASFSGNRAEMGAEIFMPQRSATRTGANGFPNGTVDSAKESFLVPEFGYNTSLSEKLAVGLTVYGNGGMNTEYPAGAPNFLGGMNGKLGINLSQLIVAPTLSYKLDDRNAIGISPLLVYQQFKAYGLDGFSGMSQDQTKLTDNGSDSSTGLGVRLGYVGKPSEVLSIGVSWSPKTKMKKLDKYAGLFAGNGGFDIPENYGLGLAVQATPTLVVGVDFQRINYANVPSVGNPSNSPGALGAANGAGFGWSNVNVVKIGVQWQANSQWTLRAGYNKTDNPIQSRDVTFNILAPGVITKHYTVGATYALSKDRELSFYYMKAPQNSVGGTNMRNDGSETIRMSQQSLGVQYGWKF